MDRKQLLTLAQIGSMAYDEYNPLDVLEKAQECEKAQINPEYILFLANECCGLYEFYNPERLLRKAIECKEAGYDPELILSKARKTSTTALQPVRVLSEIIDRSRVDGRGASSIHL